MSVDPSWLNRWRRFRKDYERIEYARRQGLLDGEDKGRQDGETRGKLLGLVTVLRNLPGLE